MTKPKWPPCLTQLFPRLIMCRNLPVSRIRTLPVAPWYLHGFLRRYRANDQTLLLHTMYACRMALQLVQSPDERLLRAIEATEQWCQDPMYPAINRSTASMQARQAIWAQGISDLEGRVATLISTSTYWVAVYGNCEDAVTEVVKLVGNQAAEQEPDPQRKTQAYDQALMLAWRALLNDLATRVMAQ